MAARFGIGFWGVAATLTLLSSYVRKRLWHSRLRAWGIGALLSVWCIAVLETYLGYSGIYHGALGTAQRVPQPFDHLIIASLLWVYDVHNSIAFWITSVTVLVVAVSLFFYERRRQSKVRDIISKAHDLLACIGAFAIVLALFPFTNPFDVDHIGFRKAYIRANATLNALGDEEVAVKKLDDDVDLLKKLYDILRGDLTAKKSQILTEKFDDYLKLLIQLDHEAVVRSDIDPNASYDQAILMKELQPQRDDPAEFIRPPPEEGKTLSAEDLIGVLILENKATEIRKRGRELQKERVDLFKKISETIKHWVYSRVRDDVSLATAAANNIIRLVTVRPIDEAISAMEDEIQRLKGFLNDRKAENERRRVENERRRVENERRRAELEPPASQNETDRRNVSTCEQVMPGLVAFLSGPEGVKMRQRILESQVLKPEAAREAFDPNTIATPPKTRSQSPTSRDPPTEGQPREETQKNLNGSAPNPQTSVSESMWEEWMREDETGTPILRRFVERLCTEGRSQDQILNELISRAESLSTQPVSPN